MSDTVTKYYEMVESGEIEPGQMPVKQDNKIYIIYHTGLFKNYKSFIIASKQLWFF